MESVINVMYFFWYHVSERILRTESWNIYYRNQLHFIMYRKSNLVEIKNCKVIPGDHVAPQHRLVVMDVNVRNPRGGNRNYEKKIRWTALRNPEKLQEFKTKVLNRLTTTEEGVQGWWENISRVLRNVAREVLG